VGKRQASYAALTVAHAAARAGAWSVAERVLALALPLAEGEAAALVRQQAALVRLAQNDPQGALALLESSVPAPFAPLMSEVRGDALAMLGNREAAERSYVEALTSAQDPMWRSILEAKRDQLRARSTY
jgi:predicted negative regulator of RcsB-dependent stress response